VASRFLSYEPNKLTTTKTIQVNLSTAPPVAKQKYNTAVHIRMYAFVCVCIVTGGAAQHTSLTQQTVSRAHDVFENFKLNSPNSIAYPRLACRKLTTRESPAECFYRGYSIVMLLSAAQIWLSFGSAKWSYFWNQIRYLEKVCYFGIKTKLFTRFRILQMFYVQASTRQALNMTLAFKHNSDAEIQDSRGTLKRTPVLKY
jgi:hypothetical protein